MGQSGGRLLPYKEVEGSSEAFRYISATKGLLRITRSPVWTVRKRKRSGLCRPVSTTFPGLTRFKHLDTFSGRRMASDPTSPSLTQAKFTTRPVARVLVATTAMLTFISFWRAAAIVLNDLASSAYYAGGEAEQFIGKTAPWFILATMLLSYAVSQLYIESCSMFVRGGVYRVVKEAMGGTLAKVSVSALMFDYVLTGPISGVAAGRYLVGVLNELFSFMHLNIILNANIAATIFAIAATLFFWWQNTKGVTESSQKAMRIMQITTVMVVILIGWCIHTVWLRHPALPPIPQPKNLKLGPNAMGWLYGVHFAHFAGILAI